MAREKQVELIKQIEKLRGRRLLCYVTGDRKPVSAQIGDDALRPLFDHLREMGQTDGLDLFLYSRGGAIDVPWRIVTTLRNASKQWHMLIPFRANSAATLIALGADAIIFGTHGELGPIDPIITLKKVGSEGTLVQEQISVEDIMAYMEFVQERAGLSDQEALTACLLKLADRIDAVLLGQIHRTHSHIRDVARRVLLSRKEPPSEQTMSTIIENLAERVYAHGHAINLKDAEQIGLPVEAASDDLDDLMWQLLQEYEKHMKLLEPLDPVAVLEKNDPYTEEATVALVESTGALHEFRGQIHVEGQRQVPQQLNVALNLNLQLEGINVEKLPAAAQQVLQQIIQAAQKEVVQQSQQAVQDALKKQAPLTGAKVSIRGGSWVRKV